MNVFRIVPFQLCADVTGMKIGTVTEGFPNTNVSLMVMEAAHKLSEKGATLEEVSIPMHSDGQCVRNCFRVCLIPESSNIHIFMF